MATTDYSKEIEERWAENIATYEHYGYEPDPSIKELWMSYSQWTQTLEKDITTMGEQHLKETSALEAKMTGQGLSATDAVYQERLGSLGERQGKEMAGLEQELKGWREGPTYEYLAGSEQPGMYATFADYQTMAMGTISRYEPGVQEAMAFGDREEFFKSQEARDYGMKTLEQYYTGLYGAWETPPEQAAAEAKVEKEHQASMSARRQAGGRTHDPRVGAAGGLTGALTQEFFRPEESMGGIWGF